ncbi:PREDICTED: dual specificity protein phosphatase 3-like [Priapulus caudatus]|uniref:Dual specificity protein phosphatase n=1 Tax=Priapulus caudatus TaxID=37621 RepID=A0ABM1E5P5_PRICU|nr:PREDICTED: dual specificity protein phosphatase 3-like [Priapulus caudatus]
MREKLKSSKPQSSPPTSQESSASSCKEAKYHKTTVDALKKIIYDVHPSRSLASKLFGPPQAMSFIVAHSFDEVYPNLFISDKLFVTNKELLKSVGITHVLNTAQGTRYAQVNTNQAYYTDLGITYYGIFAEDTSRYNLSVHFSECAYFIDSALKSGGKVVVHCYQGISRSATITAAFLLLKRGMSADKALRTLRKKREVFPNEGFIGQLCKLNNSLAAGVAHADAGSSQ